MTSRNQSPRAAYLLSAFMALTAHRSMAAYEAPAADADPFLECISSVSSEAQFSNIASKLPLRNMGNISFSMLADETKPTVAERREIAEWFDRRDACKKNTDEYHQTHWPPEFVQLANEAAAASSAIGVDLFNQKLTYGQANKRIQQVVDDLKARMIPVVKQYQAETAAQRLAADLQIQRNLEAKRRQDSMDQANAQADNARQQSLRQQRSQLIMNYLQNQQRNQYVPSPTYTTNCWSAGNNTNCTTQ